MSIPVKITAVYDTATYACSVSVHVFGSRMNHDVSSPFKWAAVDRGRESVVNNQGNPVTVCDTCELFNIQNYQSRIRDGPAPLKAKIPIPSTESGFSCFAARFHERERPANLWLIGQKVCPEHLFTPLRTGTLSRDAIRPRQAPLPISAERRPRLP